MSLLSATLFVWLLVAGVDARRSLQKYAEQDDPSSFRAFGLRKIREPLERASVGSRAVGLRAALADFLDGEQNSMINSSSSRESYVYSPDKRSAAETAGTSDKLNYLISPISNQILLDSERDLANSVADSLSEKYQNPFWPRAQQDLTAAQDCRTIRTSVELTKDDVDKASGQLVRNCKGAVALNRCEGSCSSSVLPSVRARNGFKKVSDLNFVEIQTAKSLY